MGTESGMLAMTDESERVEGLVLHILREMGVSVVSTSDSFGGLDLDGSEVLTLLEAVRRQYNKPHLLASEQEMYSTAAKRDLITVQRFIDAVCVALNV